MANLTKNDLKVNDSIYWIGHYNPSMPWLKWFHKIQTRKFRIDFLESKYRVFGTLREGLFYYVEN